MLNKARIQKTTRMKQRTAALLLSALGHTLYAQPAPAVYWTMDQIVDGAMPDQNGVHHAKIAELLAKKDAKSGNILPDFTPSTKPGVKGGALFFPMSEQGFLKVPTSKKLDFKHGLTFSSWVKVVGANSLMVLATCAEDIPKPKGGWTLSYSFGTIRLKAVDTGGEAVTVVSPKDSVPANYWVHVAAVANDKALRLYLNGVEAASHPFTGPIQKTDMALVLGNHAGIETFRHHECPAFYGLMDEVKFFEAPLSAADIRAESEQALDAP